MQDIAKERIRTGKYRDNPGSLVVDDSFGTGNLPFNGSVSGRGLGLQSDEKSSENERTDTALSQNNDEAVDDSRHTYIAQNSGFLHAVDTDINENAGDDNSEIDEAIGDDRIYTDLSRNNEKLHSVDTDIIENTIHVMEEKDRKLLQNRRTVIIENISKPITVVEELDAKELRQDVASEVTPRDQVRQIVDDLRTRDQRTVELLYERHGGVEEMGFDIPTNDVDSTRDDEPVLVNQNELNRRWLDSRINGKGKKEFKSMCSNICSYIKNKSSEILYVWPAYDSSNNWTVEFIIVSKQHINVKQLNLKYAAVVRLANTFSEEAIAVMHVEENDETFRLSIQNAEKIQNAINNHAENLMQKHRYLSVISGSGVRSRGFRNGPHQLVHKECIVMYVHTKGKIPVDETELPQTIEGIAVDVREGEFQTYASAKEYQDHLRIGCQIECEKYGTLGCFLHHPKYGLCAITCAHVVLNDGELYDLRGQTKTWKIGEKNVYQPAKADHSNNYCGRVVETMFKSGDKTTSGVDLAVIKIDVRPPEGGNFPESGKDGEDKEYNSGHINPTVIHSHNLAMKFGMETNKTRGHVQFSNTVVKNIDWDQKYEVGSQQKTYILYRQLEVQAAGFPGQFAKNGDSGAPVFITDVYDDLVCIGMVVGGNESNGNVIVTPVSSIMSELGVSEFQNFKVRKLEKHLATIEDKQDGMNDDIKQIKETLISISQKLDTR